MSSTLARKLKLLLYRVNWGAVCYFLAAIFGSISVFAIDSPSNFWWAYFLGYATIAVIFVAIGIRESARYFCRMQKQREYEFEKYQKRCKLRSNARKALEEHEEAMRSKSTVSQI